MKKIITGLAIAASILSFGQTLKKNIITVGEKDISINDIPSKFYLYKGGNSLEIKVSDDEIIENTLVLEDKPLGSFTGDEMRDYDSYKYQKRKTATSGKMRFYKKYFNILSNDNFNVLLSPANYNLYNINGYSPSELFSNSDDYTAMISRVYVDESVYTKNYFYCSPTPYAYGNKYHEKYIYSSFSETSTNYAINYNLLDKSNNKGFIINPLNTGLSTIELNKEIFDLNSERIKNDHIVAMVFAEKKENENFTCSDIQNSLNSFNAIQGYEAISMGHLMGMNYSSVISNNEKVLNFDVLEPISLNSDFKLTFCQSETNVDLISNIENLYPGANPQIRVNGVLKSILNASTLNPGIHELSISLDYENGTYSKKYSFEVKKADDITLNNIGSSNELCSNSGKYTLSASVNNGTWSYLSGGSNDAFFFNKFDSDVANAGIHKMSHTFTNTFGCISVDTITVAVTDAPTLNIGNQVDVCENGQNITLNTYLPNGLSPDRAVWKHLGGSAVYDDNGSYVFAPTIADKNINTISLEYTDPSTGCISKGTKQIKVNEKPFVSAGVDVAVCSDAIEHILDYGTPAGGSWSGNGISSNKLIIANLPNLGNVNASYKVTDDITGCSNIDQSIIIINETPDVSHSDMTVCSNSGSVTIAGGNPSNGFYSSNAVSIVNNRINVNALAPGSDYLINYKVTNNQSQCTNDVNFTFSVRNTVDVDPGPNLELCIDQVINLSGNPSGGSWKGPGIVGSSFSSFGLTAGQQYTVYYEVTNQGTGCSGIEPKVIKVNDIPNITILGGTQSLCDNGDSLILNNVATPFDLQNSLWKGTGVLYDITNQQYYFDPKSTGSGIIDISYEYSDPTTKCKSTKQYKIGVSDSPVPSLLASYQLCEKDNIFDLNNLVLSNNTVSSKQWIGENINGTIFNTPISTPKAYSVSYKETKNNCFGIAKSLIILNPLPIVDAGTDTSVCENVRVISLNPKPFGAIWLTNSALSGNDLSISKINGANTTLTLQYTDPITSCSNSDNIKISKLNKPLVTADLLKTICSNSTPLVLQSGLPLGGNYFGAGVVDDKLYPSIVGVGNKEIFYTFEDSKGCSDTVKINLVSNQPTNSTAGNDTLLCASADDLDLSTYITSFPNGTGQTWKMDEDNGILQNVLRPRFLEKGEYVVYKEYEDANNCISLDSLILRVEDGLAAPTISGLTELCYGDTSKLAAQVNGEDVQTLFNWYIQGVDSVFFTGKDNNFVPSEDIVWFVEAENGFGCPSIRKKHEVDVSKPKGLIVIEKDTVEFGDLMVYKVTNLQDVKTVKWTFGDNTNSSFENAYKYHHKEGINSVSILLTSDLDCKKTITIDTAVFVKKNPIEFTLDGGNYVDVNGSLSSAYFNVYPTNVENILNIDVYNASNSNFDFSIYNTLGVLIEEGSLRNVDMSTYSKGMYILHITNNSTNSVEKIKINKI